MTAGMERVKGIEPSLEAWEAPVLPLNYTRFQNIIAHFTDAYALEPLPEAFEKTSFPVTLLHKHVF